MDRTTTTIILVFLLGGALGFSLARLVTDAPDTLGQQGPRDSAVTKRIASLEPPRVPQTLESTPPLESVPFTSADRMHPAPRDVRARLPENFGCLVGGRVVDQEGKPLKGCIVHIGPALDADTQRVPRALLAARFLRAVADQEGRFKNLVPSGGRYWVLAQWRACTPRVVPPFHVPPGVLMLPDLVIVTGEAEITGNVTLPRTETPQHVTAERVPHPNKNVWPESEDMESWVTYALGGLVDPNTRNVTARLDADGNFRLRDLAPGSHWRLRVFSENLVSEPSMIPVVAPAANVHFVLSPGGGFRGQVVGAKRENIFYQVAFFTPANEFINAVRCEADGSFEMKGLRATTGNLRAFARVEVPEDVIPDETSYPGEGWIRNIGVIPGRVIDGLRIVIERPSILSGIAVDAQGNGIPDVSIRAVDPYGLEHTCKTDARGHFKLIGLPPEATQLQASTDNFSFRPTTVLPNGGFVTLKGEPPGTILMDFGSSTLLPTSSIMLQDRSAERIYRFRLVPENGTVRLPDILAGTYEITYYADPSDHGSNSGTVTVAPAETTRWSKPLTRSR